MAEILIKGIEMPKYCRHCRFESSSIHGQYCILTKKFTRLDDNEDGSERHISCPLVEVPPHGELKNATHIINELERQLEMEKKAETPFSESAQGNAYMRKCRIEVLEWVIRNIKNQPTIVEASKERK